MSAFWSATPFGRRDAFRVMTDLSTLPEVAAAGWDALGYAEEINDRGQIVGGGVLNGVSRGFLVFLPCLADVSLFAYFLVKVTHEVTIDL